MSKKPKKIKFKTTFYIIFLCIFYGALYTKICNACDDSTNNSNITLLLVQKSHNNIKNRQNVQYNVYPAILPKYYLCTTDNVIYYPFLNKTKKSWNGSVTNFIDFIEIISKLYNVTIKYDYYYKEQFEPKCALTKLKFSNKTLIEVLQRTFEICYEVGFPKNVSTYNFILPMAIIRNEFIQLTCVQLIKYKSKKEKEIESSVEFSVFEKELTNTNQ